MTTGAQAAICRDQIEDPSLEAGAEQRRPFRERDDRELYPVVPPLELT